MNIAYQVVGDGPFDLIHVPPFISNLELQWENPDERRYFERLSSFCRLIMFDKRGTGLSDRVAVATLEERMDDLRAVMDAVGSQRAAVYGSSEGGALSVLFTATYPDRVSALVLYGAYPRRRGRRTTRTAYHRRYGLGAYSISSRTGAAGWREVCLSGPSRRTGSTILRGARCTADGNVCRQARRGCRAQQMIGEMDVRHLLPAIRVRRSLCIGRRISTRGGQSLHGCTYSWCQGRGTSGQ